jgi:hypothetical protein
VGRDRVKLLFGPYPAPAVRVGERAFCLYRGCEVVITSWTAAPIRWPRGRPPGGRGAGGLLVNDELLRAIQQESPAALKHWWGVNGMQLWKWRKALVRSNGKGNPRPRWTEEELALLGTAPDEEIAGRIGRTKTAVYLQRWSMGIANPFKVRQGRRRSDSG